MKLLINKLKIHKKIRQMIKMTKQMIIIIYKNLNMIIFMINGTKIMYIKIKRTQVMMNIVIQMKKVTKQIDRHQKMIKICGKR